jgi:SAM-dependent methyltransferase
MAFYDFYAARKVSPLGAWLNSRLARRIAADVTAAAPEKGVVVEIGCGNGRIAAALGASVAYKGYEPNPTLAEALRRQGRQIENRKVPPLLEQDDSADAVILVHVLEHMRDHDEALKLLSEIRRVLKKGGRLFMVCPDYIDLGASFFDFDATHSYITTPNRLTQLLADAGLHTARMRFVYGALPAFPGILFHRFVKLLFWPLSLFEGDVVTEIKGFWRIKYAFVRSVYVRCEKK